jgi:signal transduction histidine kinase
MTERLAALGGTLEAGRRDDGGWMVTGSIPAGEGDQ